MVVMIMNPTEALVDSIVNTEYHDIPQDVIDHAKLAILDYVGVAVYGSQHEVGDKITDYVEQNYTGTVSSVIGRGKNSPAGSALANGTFGHAIDYDDTFQSIVIHPTSPIFSAALSIGEKADAEGKDVLSAYIIGCETSYRVGQSICPEHIDDGWHCTSTAGSFGAAAAASKVLDNKNEETAHALGIVGSGSSALKKNFGTMTKPLHAGHAAEQGVRAAMLANNGFTADPEILQGDLGYCEVMTHDHGHNPSEAVNEFGSDWAVLDIGFKPYPSGVITHAAMDALRDLILQEELEIDDISEIRAALDDAASEMLHHKRPKNALEAKFSIEFCLAAVLLSEDPGVQEFSDEYVKRQKVQEAIPLVTREFERDLFDGGFADYGARITVETTDGSEYVKEVMDAPGTPSNPLTEERIYNKFNNCVGSVYNQQKSDEIASHINKLDNISLSEFSACISEV
jgi:2-methylcitrate dehydratase PrpD